MNTSSEPTRQLVFLIGTPHSGSQWVQLLLAQHPAVATGAATDLFSRYLYPLLAAPAANGAQPRPSGLVGMLQPAEYRKFVTSVAAVALRRIAARKPKARVLLEASPDHALVWREILGYYPQARFIHVVRDPRSVVAALRAASPAANGKGSAGVVEAALVWQQEVEGVRELVEDGRRCFEIRYESLRRKPAEILGELLQWLGVPTEPEQCVRYVARLAQHPIAKSGLPWATGPQAAVALETAAADWDGELRGPALACVEMVNRDAMIRYEYDSLASRGGRGARLRLAAHRWLVNLERRAGSLRSRL